MQTVYQILRRGLLTNNAFQPQKRTQLNEAAIGELLHDIFLTEALGNTHEQDSRRLVNIDLDITIDDDIESAAIRPAHFDIHHFEVNAEETRYNLRLEALCEHQQLEYVFEGTISPFEKNSVIQRQAKIEQLTRSQHR